MVEMANWLGTPEAYATPNQQKAAQEYASALLKHSMSPIYANSFRKALPQGLAHMTEALVGGLDTYRGGQRERAAMAQAAKAYPNEQTDPALAGRRAEMEPPPQAPGPRLAGPMPTPDTTPVAPGAKTGDIFGGMPGWAPGERPMDMGDAPTAPPAGPQMAGGPMPYAPTSPGAPPAMARSLAGTPAGGGKPALGVTNGPDPTTAQGPIPPGLMPSPPMVGRKQFEAAMSNPWLPKEHKDAIMGMYYGQGQPITTEDAAGNKVIVNPRNPSQQRPVYTIDSKPLEAGDVKTQRRTINEIDPATGLPRTRVNPTVYPGAGPAASAPGAAPPNAPPPSMGDSIPGLNFAPTEKPKEGPKSLSDWLANPDGPMQGPPGQSAVPFSNAGPKLGGPSAAPDTTDGQGGTPPVKMAQAGPIDPEIQAMKQWSDDMKFKQHQREKTFDVDTDALEKRYTKIADNGLAATEQRSQLLLARNLVDNDRFYSGPGADAVLMYKQLKSLASKDPQAAAAMEMFRKVTSGAILGEMRSTLQGLGQVRIAEIDLLGKAMGNLSNTRDANRGVLDLTLRSNAIVSHLSDMASKYKQGWRWDEKGQAHQTNEPPTDAGLAETMQKWADKLSMKPEQVKEFENRILPPKPEKAGKAPASAPAPALNAPTKPPPAGFIPRP